MKGDMQVSERIETEVEKIASEVLDRIKHSPEMAMEIGNLLIEAAERDVAEAFAERNPE